MISMTAIYVVVTVGLFSFTVYDQWVPTQGYFAAVLSYMSNETNLFIVYNLILSIALIVYQLMVWVFFERTLEGQVLKITDRLKVKLIDIIFFCFIIQLKFDFQVYLVLVVLIFLFVLHTHVAFRAQFLVHAHTTSTSLNLNYRLLALFLTLFFFDYQVLKFAGAKLLSVNDQSEALFLYYVFSIAALLADPFLQFSIDFYEKFTFTHFKNSDEFLAIASLVVNIPRLMIQVVISAWITYKFSQPLFFVVCGIDNISQLKNTIDSFYRIRKLTTSMSLLKRLKGEDLDRFHDLTCTVCYDDMKDAVMLPCNHIFHEQCIRQWIIKNLNHFCPKCKKEFNFEEIGKEYKEQVVEEREHFDHFKNFLSNASEEREGEENEEGEEGEEEGQMKRQEQQDQQIDSQPRKSDFNQRSASKRRVKQKKNTRNKRSAQQSRVSDRILMVNEDVSSLPLQFYELTKKRVVAVGSIAYGLPTAAVNNRNKLHMRKRAQFGKEIQVALRLMQMTRNEQLLFL